MYTADPGQAGLGLRERRMMVPRGKMLGGSSGINYMAYVRGHPGDFDAWSDGGAAGWGYDELLPYFRKSEGLSPSGDIVVDFDAHNTEGPLGRVGAAAGPAGRPAVRRGRRRRRASRWATTTAAIGAARTASSRCCRPQPGTASGPARTTRFSRARPRRGRTSTSSAARTRPGSSSKRPRTGSRATGVEYRTQSGESAVVHATKDIVLSAGAVGSPQLLLLSGIGPKDELEPLGITCRLDSPDVGKHLQDHLQLALVFPAPGSASR